MPSKLTWLIAFAAGMTFTACSDRSPVVIGVASNMPEPSVAGVAQAALDATQPAGGRHITVSTGNTPTPSADHAGLQREIDRALQFVADRNVVAVAGPGGSREALQTGPVYREAEVPNVVPTATSRRVRELGKWTFVLAADDSVQGEFIGEFAAERLHARTAAIFYLPDEYGLGLAAGTAAALSRRGITLLARTPVQPTRSCQPDATVNAYEDAVDEAFRAGAPDVVVLATRSRESPCLARAVAARSSATRFIAGDGATVDPAFIRFAGPAADSMYLVSFWHPTANDSAARAFVARFRAIVGREPRHDEAMFYDSIMLLGQAIRSVGPSRAAIRDYLEELGTKHPPYAGLTGPISFGRDARRPLITTRLSGGQLQVVPTP